MVWVIKELILKPKWVRNRCGRVRKWYENAAEEYGISWINIAKSNSPRGFNVRGISHTKRRRNRATAQRRRLRRLHASGRLHIAPSASDDDSSQEGSVGMPASSDLDSDDDSTAPPPPPLSLHADMMTEVEAESDASPDHDQAEVTDSASHTAYARRTFVNLMNLRQRQTPATWDATAGLLIEDVFGENAILQYLEPFRLRLLHKLHSVLRSFTIERLNQCRPDGAQGVWCFYDVQFMGYLLETAAEQYAPNPTRPAQAAARKLLIVPFHNTVLDKARLNAILHSAAVQRCIAPAHRDLVGDCMVAYRYDTPIGRRWHNVKRYALMTNDELNRLRTEPCGCGAVPGEFKSDALTPGESHLLTTDPHFLPTPNLQRVCQMGSKYRPSVSSAASHLDSVSREQVLHDVTAPIKRFALGAEGRIGMSGSMRPWLTEAMSQIQDALDGIPDGTSVHSTP